MYESKDIRCPFFRSGEGKKGMGGVIRCEGIGEAESVTLGYRTGRQRERQMSIFCRGCYTRCEIYRMIVESHGWE